MGLVGKAVGVGAVLIIAAVYSSVTSAQRDTGGGIVDGGTLSVFEIQIGDCISDSITGTLTEASAVPCSEAHIYEAYFNSELPQNGSFSDVNEFTDEACYSNFEAYVGVSPENTDLTFVSLIPTVGSWDSGDRKITCLLSNLDESEIVGSYYQYQ